MDQAQTEIGKLQALAEDPKFRTPWLHVGCQRAVPACACPIGQYKGREGACVLWVTADQLPFLKEFTLTILVLASPDKQELSPGGAVFSPAVR